MSYVRMQDADGKYGEYPYWDAEHVMGSERLKPMSFQNWYKLPPEYRYTDQALYLLAHRGLVDNWAGIAENTFESVNNAWLNEIYMVELDAQASKDGVAMAAHDLSAARITALPGNIADYTAAELMQQKIVIRNPLDGYSQNTRNHYGFADMGSQSASYNGVVTDSNLRLKTSWVRSHQARCSPITISAT